MGVIDYKSGEFVNFLRYKGVSFRMSDHGVVYISAQEDTENIKKMYRAHLSKQKSKLPAEEAKKRLKELNDIVDKRIHSSFFIQPFGKVKFIPQKNIPMDRHVMSEAFRAAAYMVHNQSLPTKKSIIGEILEEKFKTEEIWGEQNHNLTDWIAILTEEVGEAAKEAVDFRFKNAPKDSLLWSPETEKQRLVNYRKELIQCGNIILKMIESVDRNEMKEYE